MKRTSRSLARILTATAAALALTSSLALAAEPAAKPAAPAMPAANMPAGMGQHGGMGLASLSPEKQAIARTLMADHAKALAPLHQSMYAKGMELEALNAAGEGDSAKARAAIRDISDLEAKMLTENAKFRAQMVKKTGLRTPIMGHGMMGGMMGQMMPGMMGGKGMMGQGGMSCSMMQGMAGMAGGQGHAGHGAPAAGAPAAPAGAPAAPATDAHATHAN